MTPNELFLNQKGVKIECPTFENTLVDENDKLSAMRIVIFSLFKMLYNC